MQIQSAALQRLRKQYGKCCVLSLSVILLGLTAAIVCNYAFGNAYLGFAVSLVIYLIAVAYQLFITVKASAAAKKASLEEAERMSLNKFTFRLCALVIGCTAVQIAACTPLIKLPWAFAQQIIAIGWLENAWLPCVITAGVCVYLWWFLDTTAIIRGYWKHTQSSRKEKNRKSRFLLTTLAALLAVLLVQLVFNCISTETLAGGNVYDNWEDFTAFMELPRDEWGNVVDRWLDTKTQIYAEDGTTVLCEYVKMNFSIDHILYADHNDMLPVTVYTNRQMLDAANLQKNVNLFLYALYIVIPLSAAGFYFWKHKFSANQPPK